MTASAAMKRVSPSRDRSPMISDAIGIPSRIIYKIIHRSAQDKSENLNSLSPPSFLYLYRTKAKVCKGFCREYQDCSSAAKESFFG